MAPNKQYKIAGETLYIYAPLAHRLGLFAIKTELEDLSFKYEHPGEYERITRLIRQSEAGREMVYNDFATPILKRLDTMGLNYEAKARLKSVYSIWRKMDKYKIGEHEEESELNVWLKTIKDILDDPTPNAIDFLDTLKLNLFATEIVVFTPKGELVTLPAGATVLDVAFSLHSEIGMHCIAGKVNHKLVPLSHSHRKPSG